MSPTSQYFIYLEIGVQSFIYKKVFIYQYIHISSKRMCPQLVTILLI